MSASRRGGVLLGRVLTRWEWQLRAVGLQAIPMAQQSIRGGVACCGVEAEYLALAFLSDREGAGWLSACRMSNPARTGVTSAGVLVVATVIALAPRGARGAVVMGAAPGMWGCMAARSSATSSTVAASVGDSTGGGRLHWHIPLVPFNCAAVTY